MDGTGFESATPTVLWGSIGFKLPILNLETSHIVAACLLQLRDEQETGGPSGC